MKSAVVGFPRVGKFRELKFASEKYFRGESDSKELLETAKELRKEHLDWQKKSIHTHMCYSEFNDIIRDIDRMDADVISFEASRSNLTILDAIKESHFETEVGSGEI